jgi:hypothetical protein
MRQKNHVELNLGAGAKDEARSAAARAPEACAAKACLERPAVTGPSMEAVVERENLKTALAQVKQWCGGPRRLELSRSTYRSVTRTGFALNAAQPV